MGGRLHLNNGQPANRGNVCVSGYSKSKDNYALSNFENNGGKGYRFDDPDLGEIHFPTAEHYLHFQKLTPAGKQANLALWQQEPSPSVLLSGIRAPASPYYIKPEHSKYNTTTGFNNAAWDNDKIYVQMQINATKYQQSPGFKQSINQAIELGQAFKDGHGAATIIEDTSSASREEKIWGTGPDGKGTNILGNTQTAFANMVQQGQVPASTQPPKFKQYYTQATQASYQNAEAQYKSGVQPALQTVRAKSGKNKGANQPDTSDLNQRLVQPIAVASQRIISQRGMVQPTPHHKAPSSITGPSTTKKHPPYENRASTRRIILDPVSGKFIRGEWRKSPTDSWKKGGNPTRFNDLIEAHKQSVSRKTMMDRFKGEIPKKNSNTDEEANIKQEPVSKHSGPK